MYLQEMCIRDRGYTIPKVLTRQIGLEKIRFYVSAQNLFTITSYSGYDPELGIDTIGADLESCLLYTSRCV